MQSRRRKAMTKDTKGKNFLSKINLIEEIPKTNMAARKKEDTKEGIPTQVLDLGPGQIGEEEIENIFDLLEEEHPNL